MTKKERENIYDSILIYLKNNRGGRSVGGILRNTNEYYKEQRYIIKELILLDYIEETKHQNESSFSLSAKGEMFINSSSFLSLRKKGNMKKTTKIIKTIGIIVGILAALATVTYYIIKTFNLY